MPGYIFITKGELVMSCLLKFNWVKLPRDTLPPGKGLMGAWARLAARAAFRPGQANYCGYRNEVDLASWVGGIVGLKSILGVSNRQKALEVMNALKNSAYLPAAGSFLQAA